MYSVELGQISSVLERDRNKKGLRQCAKLYDFGEVMSVVIVVVVVPGQ